MRFLLILLIIFLIFFLLGKINDFRIRKREKQIAQEFGSRADSLLEDISHIDIEMIHSRINSIKNAFFNSLVILQDKDGIILNLCPKCHDTLIVRKTQYYGKILGCPNYPSCRHLVRVASLKPHIFHELNIKGLDKE